MTKSKKDRIVLWIVFAVFLIYALTLIFPFIWVFYSSFKTNWELLTDVWGLPDINPLNTENYVYIFQEYDFPYMFFNSILLTFTGATLNVLLSSMAAYVVAKYRFRGRNIIYIIALSVMLIPTTGSLASMYKFMSEIDLMETYPAVLLQYCGAFGINFLMLYSYFRSISWTYAEAAFVDGASNIKVFFTIMLPLAKGGLAAVFLLQAIGFWNDFFTPFMFLSTKPTIAVGLQNLSAQASAEGKYTQMFSAIVIATIPIIVVFCVFERTIIENMVAGGIKG